jgi:hypothetical protein
MMRRCQTISHARFESHSLKKLKNLNSVEFEINDIATPIKE